MCSSSANRSGVKLTRARRTILEVLERADGPLSAEEIYSRARQKAQLSLATVYRGLSALCDAGLLMKNLSQDGRRHYQPQGRQHKHFLVCTRCGRTVPLEDCPLEPLAREMAVRTGFVITGHNLELLGVCPACAGA